ncbi:hypothetical protein [Acutalibacter muris]|uniref:hypothetical protein n=1 Tax=Acutalibacter muris TaxID=1796620 RepID=UPI00272E3D44|nr:hypothetical protein [Acutalibacter muris]
MSIAMDTFELIMSADGNITGGSMYPTCTIGKLFGVTDRHIQQLTKDGVLPATETPNGRQYDLVPTIQAYIRYLRDTAHGKTGSEREQELKQQKLMADIALKESAHELHRLKMDIAAGKYISVEEATLDYARFFVAFKKFALSLPGRLISRIGGVVEPTEARRIEKELQGDVTQLLRAFVVAGVDESQIKGTGVK